MKTALPFVHRFRDRHGKVRHYYRRGDRRAALPDPAADMQAFLEAYQAAAAGRRPSRYAAGTMAALMAEYLASPAFRSLRPTSQKAYRLVIEFLRGRPSADARVDMIRRAHIIRLRDELADTPGKANITLSVVSSLMAFAIEREYREDNPAIGIKRFALGEHRAWLDAEHAAFADRWQPGTMERRAYALALYTGQRREDLARMTWKDRRDGLIHIVQGKTRVELWIPEHRILTTELALAGDRHIQILHSAKGGAFSPDYLGEWFAAAIDAAGLPADCVLHGLRKSATVALAEAGCSEREIMAITGHKTTAMVTHYAKAASRRKMAVDAMKKLQKDRP